MGPMYAGTLETARRPLELAGWGEIALPKFHRPERLTWLDRIRILPRWAVTAGVVHWQSHHIPPRLILFHTHRT
jgi:hypothetical protein